MSVIDEIFTVFHDRGDTTYLGEPVTLTEHMLQSASAAERDGAPATLVAAAVLHDFGHLVHDLDPDCAEQGVDSLHEDVGSRYLERHFPPAVTEPIRLHVASKRYLCAVEPEYLSDLSEASRRSLELQGGPFTPEGVAEFERNPFATDAVRLRRYDDVAKVPGLETPPLEHYRAVLQAVLEP
jgi:phosphonate degradation associated HDIG domain protein